MNIRDFQYIIAVNEFKSFIRASKKCFVSQPALSMQIHKIEEEIGVKIFERNKRNVITTTEGLKVVEYAKSLLEVFDNIKNLKNEAKTLNVGLIYTVSCYLLSIMMAKLNLERRDAKIIFFEEGTKNLIKDLNEGLLDGILIASTSSCLTDETKIAKGMEAIAIYEEKLALVVPNNEYFAKKGDTLSLKEIKELTLADNFIMLKDGNCLAEHIKTILLKYKINFKNSKSNLLTSNVETIIKMIISNNGVSILPKKSVEGLSGVKYFDLPNKEGRTISLVYRKNTSKLNDLNSLADLIKNSI
jgi:LysR family hydrogen peroxide-inducible transcriptional activator